MSEWTTAPNGNTACKFLGPLYHSVCCVNATVFGETAFVAGFNVASFPIFLQTSIWGLPLEILHLENINLSEVLPRISDINVLPFGMVKMDLTGKILEYNMAEAELTGTDPAWALGKNFFHEVATCTNTPAFYGKFAEGVSKGFLNAVFNYSFTHCETPVRVRIHMITMPDSRGQKIVVLMVTRVKQPVQVTEAFQISTNASDLAPVPAEAAASHSDAAAKRVANAIMSAANHQPVEPA